MKILAMANLYDITYEDLDFIIVDKKDEYDVVVFLGNIEISIIKHINYLISQNELSKLVMGVEGKYDNSEDLECLGIKNLHMNYETINNKKIAGYSSFSKFNLIDTHLTFIDRESKEILENLDKCDILISHNSPKGYEEELTYDGINNLNDYINKNKPSICIHSYRNSNSICTLNSTYIIGVHGIAIIDTDNFAITSFY